MSTEAQKAIWRKHSKNYAKKNKGKLAEYARNRRAKNSNIARAANLKSKYNLTLEQFEKRFEEQGSCCAICKATEPGSKNGWHVDHSHVTGKVRGILCHHCNLTIGHAKDDVERLKQILDYLAGAL
jgi:hypothetical protein